MPRGQQSQHIDNAFLGELPNYSEGYMIIVADLTPFEIGDNFDLKEQGTLSIDLVFKSPLTATIYALVYAEYDNVIEIDSNCNVIRDWSN